MAKFLFSSDGFVYLHDTNQRELFDESVRAFSSGCVRLARPLALAGALYANDGRDAAEVRRLQSTGATHRVSLDRPVPVRLVYLAAEVAADGAVHFFEDIYQRDGEMIAAR